MKQVNTVLTVILLVVLTGCGRNKQSNDDLIIVDVSKSYPKKELILQDFMNVEYVALETTDEFLTQGLVQDVGKEYLLVTNRNNDGDIFIFDRQTGKGLKKINRRGQGAEEYARINEIILDENNDEIFVKSPGNKILVYDLNGEFKRCLNLGRDISSIFDYDKHNLICYDMSDYHNKGKDRNKSYHILISKQDGSITRKISIPFDEVKSPVARDGENWENWAAPVPTAMYQIVPDHTNWVLMETSSDTIYHYLPDANTTIPLIVRTPSIHSMDPPEVFLIPTVFTDRYYFMSLLKAEFNFETGRGFPTSGLMYDRLESSLFIPKIYNGDYTSKREVDMTSRPLDPEFVIGQSLQAHELAEAYGKGVLKGKLKEIAAKLDEESNPVIMLIKHKK